jgi:translation elongation factor P/translation initiation factor 5A
MTAIDIFTARKYEEIFSSTENIDVPLVSKAEYQARNVLLCGNCASISPHSS